MPCYCTKCFPSRELTRRTIQAHLKNDRNLLSILSDHSQIAHTQTCILRTSTFLATGAFQNIPEFKDSGMCISPSLSEYQTFILVVGGIEENANVNEEILMDIDYQDSKFKC